MILVPILVREAPEGLQTFYQEWVWGILSRLLLKTEGDDTLWEEIDG